jgi:hypothetical protein
MTDDDSCGAVEGMRIGRGNRNSLRPAIARAVIILILSRVCAIIKLDLDWILDLLTTYTHNL